MKILMLYWLHRLRSKVMDRRFTEALYVAYLPDAEGGKTFELWENCARHAFLATTPPSVTRAQAGRWIPKKGNTP